MNKISIIKSEQLQFLENKSKYICVNFAYKFAVKIGYFYNEIEKPDLHELIKKI